MPGNHEFYGGQIEVRRRELREAAAEHPNVHLLDPGELLLDGGHVRVLGCTLWTDFALAVGGAGPAAAEPSLSRALAVARTGMNDYSRIRTGDADSRALRRDLKPEDTLAFHQAERAWLLAKLQEPFAGGATVVITHHGPSADSVAPRWANDALTPAFSSNLPDEFFQVPKLWVHGHTHDSRDYVRGNARVLCNPRGYLMRDGSFENNAFDQRLVVEV